MASVGKISIAREWYSKRNREENIESKIVDLLGLSVAELAEIAGVDAAEMEGVVASQDGAV